MQIAFTSLSSHPIENHTLWHFLPILWFIFLRITHHRVDYYLFYCLSLPTLQHKLLEGRDVHLFCSPLYACEPTLCLIQNMHSEKNPRQSGWHTLREPCRCIVSAHGLPPPSWVAVSGAVLPHTARPPSRGVNAAISHQALWSEVPGVRPRREEHREQANLDKHKGKEKKKQAANPLKEMPLLL